jgi:hypothetical protein
MDCQDGCHGETFARDARTEGGYGLRGPQPQESGMRPQRAGRKKFPHRESPEE